MFEYFKRQASIRSAKTVFFADLKDLKRQPIFNQKIVAEQIASRIQEARRLFDDPDAVNQFQNSYSSAKNLRHIAMSSDIGMSTSVKNPLYAVAALSESLYLSILMGPPGEEIFAALLKWASEFAEITKESEQKNITHDQRKTSNEEKQPSSITNTPPPTSLPASNHAEFIAPQTSWVNPKVQCTVRGCSDTPDTFLVGRPVCLHCFKNYTEVLKHKNAQERSTYLKNLFR